MAVNTKKTSAEIASIAAKTLSDPNSSGIQKKLAASALSQHDSAKQTGSDMETVASNALTSDKYNERTKMLAASVLAQANKGR